MRNHKGIKKSIKKAPDWVLFLVAKMMLELQNSLAAGRVHPVLITTVLLNVYSFKKSLYFVKIG